MQKGLCAKCSKLTPFYSAHAKKWVCDNATCIAEIAHQPVGQPRPNRKARRAMAAMKRAKKDD